MAGYRGPRRQYLKGYEKKMVEDMILSAYRAGNLPPDETLAERINLSSGRKLTKEDVQRIRSQACRIIYKQKRDENGAVVLHSPYQKMGRKRRFGKVGEHVPQTYSSNGGGNGHIKLSDITRLVDEAGQLMKKYAQQQKAVHEMTA